MMKLECSAGVRSIPGARLDPTRAGHFEVLVCFEVASAAALFSTGLLYSMSSSPKGGRCPWRVPQEPPVLQEREALLPAARLLELDQAPSADRPPRLVSAPCTLGQHRSVLGHNLRLRGQRDGW